MNKLIENIVHEEVERLLNESLTDIIYHFTDLKSAYQIVMDNTILLSENFDGMKYYKIGTNYHFFLSFTRQKYGKLGYSNGKEIRIIFDGGKLSQKYKGKAFDFYPGAKAKFINDMNRQLDENEDRLYSNTPAIENASKYIIGMDINFENKNFIKNISEMINTATFPIHIYLDEKDFLIGNNNYITSLENFSVKSEKLEFQKLNKNECIKMISDCIIDIFKYFFTIIESKNIDFDKEEFILYYLNKYDLNEFSDKIINKVLNDKNIDIPEIYNYDPFPIHYEGLRSYTPKTYLKISKMYMALTKKVKKL